jgi:hypothetical protein
MTSLSISPKAPSAPTKVVQIFLQRKQLFGGVTLCLVSVIMLMVNLGTLKEVSSTLTRRNMLEGNSSVAATSSNIRWGKFVIGTPAVAYPNRWVEIRQLFRRLSAHAATDRLSRDFGSRDRLLCGRTDSAAQQFHCLLFSRTRWWIYMDRADHQNQLGSC